MKLILIISMMITGASAGCGTTADHVVIREGSDLAGREGRRVVIEGTASIEIWQHMIAFRPDYPHQTYFDMGRGQIVVYSREEMSCPGAVRIEGTVIRLEGSSKNPRRKEICTEYHVLADSWECVK